jgi:hypothetical protein
MSVEDAKKAPTTLSGSALTGTDYALLWGTDKGFDSNGERDAGNKTIYDPCPVGYRVPPVGSVVFKSSNGRRSSEDENWNDNNIYWPYLSRYSSWYGDDNYKNDSDSYGFGLHWEQEPEPLNPQVYPITLIETKECRIDKRCNMVAYIGCVRRQYGRLCQSGQSMEHYCQ